MRFRDSHSLLKVFSIFLIYTVPYNISAYSNQDPIDYPTIVYCGGTHVHTNLSEDAFLWGNENLGPDAAYRFAQGDAIRLQEMVLQRRRPLDFLVVADHASAIGLFDELINKKNPVILATQLGGKWHRVLNQLKDKDNVALSGNRQDKGPDTEKLGNTVDISDASYTNTIGDSELAVVWTDPDFNKDELAFYYLRVLQIPTPRWTAYDAKHFKLKDIPEEVPMITQERAYSSPIWYTPASYHYSLFQLNQ